MKPLRILANALIVTIAALGFTACDDDPQERFVAELRSSNEVPANTSSATGRVVLLVSRDASFAEYSVEVSGLSAAITGGHFHRGAAGVNGGVIVAFSNVSELASGSIGRTLNKTELDSILADLRAGTIYANVHTTTYLGGEIRAQMTKQ